MKLRLKILLLAAVPLLVALAAITVAVYVQGLQLAQREKQVVENAWLASKAMPTPSTTLPSVFMCSDMRFSFGDENAKKGNARTCIADHRRRRTATTPCAGE